MEEDIEGLSAEGTSLHGLESDRQHSWQIT
jgi:hypothetical protein